MTIPSPRCETNDHACFAKSEGLRYVNDQKPGITRKFRDGQYVFFKPDGERITDEDLILRIRKLAVPPSYRDVWICPQANGHIQATGYDTRGRKQYRQQSVKGDTMRFEFIGKSGKGWDLAVTDRRIAKVVSNCADIPGHELFKYIDAEGIKRDVTSQDVNAYLNDIGGGNYTAKDFRTWAGTVLATVALQEFEKCDSEAQAKKNIVAAIEKVAEELGNTPAICRKCYVHPEVLDAYMNGALASLVEQKIDHTFKTRYEVLTADEIMVLAFLKKRLGSMSSKGDTKAQK